MVKSPTISVAIVVFSSSVASWFLVQISAIFCEDKSITASVFSSLLSISSPFIFKALQSFSKYISTVGVWLDIPV